MSETSEVLLLAASRKVIADRLAGKVVEGLGEVVGRELPAVILRLLDEELGEREKVRDDALARAAEIVKAHKGRCRQDCDCLREIVLDIEREKLP